jgi:acyl-CoA thioesterase-2
MDLRAILALESHGPDTYVGTGPMYPWGGLYGGQIVAQALRAAAATVSDEHFVVHSVRCYFIRRGDHSEPVRYEVDRLRNGRSFCTRRVVARQAVGAILNLECSFKVAEPSEDIQTIAMPEGVPAPETLEQNSWSEVFERATVPRGVLDEGGRAGTGRSAAWLRVNGEMPDDGLQHAAALAYLSDDMPTEAVIRAHPLGDEPEQVLYENTFSASLDHTIWFHRPMRADEWHLHDFSCHTFVGGRGLSLGQIFTLDGRHVATVAQEVLVRDKRQREVGGPTA